MLENVKTNITKYLRLYFECSIVFAMLVYFFGPILNSYYSSKRLLIIWIVVMGLVSIVSKRLNRYRENFSLKEMANECFAIFDVKQKDVIIMVLLFAVALVLRILCVQWNDPYHIYQPDDCKMVEPALMMTRSWFDLYSDYYTYPNQFLSKIVAFIYIIQGKLPGGMTSSVMAYTTYRLAVCVCGALCIFPAYMIGQRLWRKHGIVLALMTAIYPGYIKYSVQATGDVSGLLFQLMVLCFSIAWICNHKKRYAVLMGVTAAISTLEKWHNGVVCIYIAIVIIIGARKNIKELLENGVVALTAWLAGMILLAPNMLWRFNLVVEQFVTIWNYPGGEQGGRWPFFIESFFSYSGLVMGFVIVVGIVYALYTHEKDVTVVLGGLINYFVMNMIMNRLFERWACLFYFTMLTFVYIGLRFSSEKIKKMGPIMAICFCTLFIVTYVVDYAEIYVLAEAGRTKDTRYVSESYMEEIGANIDNTISGYYTTFAPAGRRIPDTADSLELTSKSEWPFVVENGKATLEVSNYKYITASDYFNSSDFEPIDRKPILELKSGYMDFYFVPNGRGSWAQLELVSIANEIKAITTIKNAEYVGPSIKVYDISDGSWMVAN